MASTAQRTNHACERITLTYCDAEGKQIFRQDGENVADVILHGNVVGSNSISGLTAALAQQAKRMAELESENARMGAL